MRSGRIILVVVGALLAVAGFGLALVGGALLGIHATQRDSAGYYRSPTEAVHTSTAALVTRLDLGSASGRVLPAEPLGTLQVRAAATTGRALFVGIARAGSVDRWLADVRHETVVGVRSGPFDLRTRTTAGSGTATAPATRTWWAASATGTGPLTLTWPSRPGHWVAVLANADASPGVAARVSVGTNTGLLLPVGLTTGAVGLVLVAGGVLAMLSAVGQFGPAGTTPVPRATGAPGAYPVRLDGRLAQPPGRWLWLVKWLLLVPHAVVLAFLWLAVLPLTVVAGVAILFTGRYPRPIFDFVVGVMRWTWRVVFYGFSALAPDRYPPFSLDPDPGYPADLAVDYPRRLSRGLVLVKWWLLAVPHYVVVAVFAGGWLAGFGNDLPRFPFSGGLIALLALVAAVILLFTGRYPGPLFDLLMGLNRWCFRVLGYAALLRDEYPPFRLDQGGPDPGHRPATPVPPDLVRPGR